MRIIVKILLSIAVLIISVVFQALISESGAKGGIIMLIPGAIFIFGLIGVWKYKPKEINDLDNTDLDKTL
jgi:hypothetical protein